MQLQSKKYKKVSYMKKFLYLNEEDKYLNKTLQKPSKAKEQCQLKSNSKVKKSK